MQLFRVSLHPFISVMISIFAFSFGEVFRSTKKGILLHKLMYEKQPHSLSTTRADTLQFPLWSLSTLNQTLHSPNLTHHITIELHGRQRPSVTSIRNLLTLMYNFTVPRKFPENVRKFSIRSFQNSLKLSLNIYPKISLKLRKIIQRFLLNFDKNSFKLFHKIRTFSELTETFLSVSSKFLQND